MTSGRTAIAASIVKRSPSARYAGPADPDQVLEATIVIRRPPAVQTSGRTREEIEKSLSADAEDIAAVTAFAHRYGLTVKEVSPEKRIVRVEGRVQNFNQAFGTELARFEESDGGTFLSYDGPLTIEPDIAGRITAALGLNQTPVARPRQPAPH